MDFFQIFMGLLFLIFFSEEARAQYQPDDTCGGYFRYIEDRPDTARINFFFNEDNIGPLFNGSKVCVWTVISQPLFKGFIIDIPTWTLPISGGCPTGGVSINAFPDHRDSTAISRLGPYCGTRGDTNIAGHLMAIVLRIEMHDNLIGKGFVMNFKVKPREENETVNYMEYEFYSSWGEQMSYPYTIPQYLPDNSIQTMAFPKSNFSESIWNFNVTLKEIEFENTNCTANSTQPDGDCDDTWSYFSVWEITRDGRFDPTPHVYKKSLNTSEVFSGQYGFFLFWNGRNSTVLPGANARLNADFITYRMTSEYNEDEIQYF